MAGLELIADTYLSVAAPVQQALPELFTIGAGIRAAIAARVAANRTVLARALEACAGVHAAAVGGGLGGDPAGAGHPQRRSVGGRAGVRNGRPGSSRILLRPAWRDVPGRQPAAGAGAFRRSRPTTDRLSGHIMQSGARGGPDSRLRPGCSPISCGRRDSHIIAVSVAPEQACPASRQVTEALVGTLAGRRASARAGRRVPAWCASAVTDRRHGHPHRPRRSRRRPVAAPRARRREAPASARRSPTRSRSSSSGTGARSATTRRRCRRRRPRRRPAPPPPAPPPPRPPEPTVTPAVTVEEHGRAARRAPSDRPRSPQPGARRRGRGPGGRRRRARRLRDARVRRRGAHRHPALGGRFDRRRRPAGRQRQAAFRRFPLRLGAYWPVPLGVGQLEPGLGLDLDLISVSIPNDGTPAGLAVVVLRGPVSQRRRGPGARMVRCLDASRLPEGAGPGRPGGRLRLRDSHEW